MSEPNEKPRLLIDSGWKDKVDREKEQLQSELKESFQRNRDIPPADFTLHCTSLATQALIFLGVIENPMTGQTEQDLEQARFLIDILAMLQEKTKGNLTDDEAASLEHLLGELKLEWVRTLNRKPGEKNPSGTNPQA